MSSTDRGIKPLQVIRSNVKAVSDLSANRFVTINATYPAEGGVALGVASYPTPTGNYASVTTYGIVTVELAGTVSENDEITPATDGKAKAYTTSEFIMGVALDSGTTGDLIRIKLI